MSLLLLFRPSEGTGPPDPPPPTGGRPPFAVVTPLGPRIRPVDDDAVALALLMLLD